MTVGRPLNARAPRGTRVWMPFRFREGLKHLRSMRALQQDGRGRPPKYTDEDFIAVYEEIEAHARLRAKGKVLRMLHLHSTRLGSEENPRRLDAQERHRLRKLHQEGKREAEHWRTTLFMGMPHPQWSAIQRRIEEIGRAHV